MLIRIFVLYTQLLSLYELDIRSWRYIMLKQPQLGIVSKEEDMELIQSLWNTEDQSFLERLKKDIA